MTVYCIYFLETTSHMKSINTLPSVETILLSAKNCCVVLLILFFNFQFLLYLQEFSQRIISQTHDIETQVDGLINSTKVGEKFIFIDDDLFTSI